MIYHLCNVYKIVELILFADDTNIFYSHENIDHLIIILNLDLRVLWFYGSKVLFYGSKVLGF